MWFVIALISAITLALQSVYTKKGTVHSNALIITLVITIITAIAYFPLLLFKGFPKVTSDYWIIMGITILLDCFGTILYIQSLKFSPVSLVVPMLSLTPIFSLVVTIFINHLYPSFFGVCGVIITLIGIYFINFDHNTKDYLSPFKSIFKERGVLYIVIATFVWSIVDSLKRVGIDASNAYSYSALYQLIWAICLTPIIYFIYKRAFRNIFTKKSIQRLFPIGILNALQVLSFNVAIMLALPAYVLSVRNTGMLFSAFFGWYFLREKIERHIIPTILIIIGVTILVFAENS